MIGNVSGSTNVDSVLKDVNMKRGARKRLAADQTVFYVYKGVKTFAYSEAFNILVTGGEYFYPLLFEHLSLNAA